VANGCIFGHPRFLLHGLNGAYAEMSPSVIAYNLKRMLNVQRGSSRQAAQASG
jgi:hypothetical protein